MIFSHDSTYIYAMYVCATESNLEIKEENQMLREQDIIRNELLTRYEKRNEDMTKEVSLTRIVLQE